MTALGKPRKIARRDARQFIYPVAGLAVCIQSGLAVLAAGAARPGRSGQGGSDAAKAADAATYQTVGVFAESVTGGASDGDAVINVEAGCFNFVNSGAGADHITAADIGRPCYVVDDQTVARTSAGGTRALAGSVSDVDDDGIWVDVGPTGQPGRRVLTLQFAINETDTLAGTSAELVSPVSGEIIRANVIVQKAVTTGGDVTLSVGVTAVAGLTCTIADGAAKGTVVTDTPTAGDVSTKVAAGGRIQVTPAAAFNTAGAVSGTVEIAY